MHDKRATEKRPCSFLAVVGKKKHEREQPSQETRGAAAWSDDNGHEGNTMRTKVDHDQVTMAGASWEKIYEDQQEAVKDITMVALSWKEPRQRWNVQWL